MTETLTVTLTGTGNTSIKIHSPGPANRSRSRIFSKNVPVMSRYGQVPDRYRSLFKEWKNYCTIFFSTRIPEDPANTPRDYLSLGLFYADLVPGTSCKSIVANLLQMERIRQGFSIKPHIYISPLLIERGYY